MKVLNKVVIGMASLCLLTACGPSKISYDKFHEKAVEAAKVENGYTKVTVNGKAKFVEESNGKKTTVEYEFDKVAVDGFTNGRMDALTLGAKMAAYFAAGQEKEIAALGLAAATAETIGNSDKLTYYDFQVDEKDEDYTSSVKFDKNGLPVSYKFGGSGSGSLTLSWAK